MNVNYDLGNCVNRSKELEHQYEIAYNKLTDSYFEIQFQDLVVKMM